MKKNISISIAYLVCVSVSSVLAQRVGTLPQTAAARSISDPSNNNNNGVVWPAKWSPGKFARAMTASTTTTTTTTTTPSTTRSPRLPFSTTTTTTLPPSTTRNARDHWKLRRKNITKSQTLPQPQQPGPKKPVFIPKKKISKESDSESVEEEEVIINDKTNTKVFELEDESLEPAIPEIYNIFDMPGPGVNEQTVPFFDNQREPPKTKLVKYLNRRKVANPNAQVNSNGQQIVTMVAVTESPIDYTYTTRKTLKRVLVKKGSYLARKMSTTTTTTTTEAPPYDLETESTSIEAETVDDDDIVGDEQKLSRIGPTGIDPGHPAVQKLMQGHKINSLDTLTSSTTTVYRKEKKYRIVDETPRLPLDKTLVYVGMIFSWIFWIVVFSTYYAWGGKHPVRPTFHRRGPDIVKTSRSMDETFTRPIRMIMLAEETYSNFNLQSLDCQKKALCELAEGNTFSSGISYLLKRLLDTAESLPSMDFVNYLKEYRDAIESPSNCTTDYSCPFSLGTVFEKWRDT